MYTFGQSFLASVPAIEGVENPFEPDGAGALLKRIQRGQAARVRRMQADNGELARCRVCGQVRTDIPPDPDYACFDCARTETENLHPANAAVTASAKLPTPESGEQQTVFTLPDLEL